jgi:hypothetical protein
LVLLDRVLLEGRYWVNLLAAPSLKLIVPWQIEGPQSIVEEGKKNKLSMYRS